jgi:hypothetical protein
MKLYRVAHCVDGGTSGGLSWETSEKDARLAVVERKRDNHPDNG